MIVLEILKLVKMGRLNDYSSVRVVKKIINVALHYFTNTDSFMKTRYSYILYAYSTDCH